MEKSDCVSIIYVMLMIFENGLESKKLHFIFYTNDAITSGSSKSVLFGGTTGFVFITKKNLEYGLCVLSCGIISSDGFYQPPQV